MLSLYPIRFYLLFQEAEQVILGAVASWKNILRFAYMTRRTRTAFFNVLKAFLGDFQH